jgi:RNA polymerase sigma factor (sigma-70 family)
MMDHSLPDLLAEQSQGKTARARRAAVEAALLDGQQRILGFLVGRLRNIEDAKDVLQDFSMRAITRADDLRDVASVRGWLGRLLATAITDHHRRAARRPKPDLGSDALTNLSETLAHPDAETDAVVCDCLHDLIGLLDPGTGDLLRRIDLLGQSRDEVARSLNISEGTLAVRLHRARRKLRDLLIQMCVTCPEHGFLDCACDRARARQHAASAVTSGGSL